MTKDNQTNLNTSLVSNPVQIQEQIDGRYLTKAKQDVLVKLIAQGTPANQIEGITGTSENTIQTVAETCHAEIERMRKRLAGRLSVIVEPMLDRIHEQVLDKSQPVSVKDLSISTGIFIDKIDRLSNVPTQIIRVEESDPGRSEYERWLHAKEINISDDGHSEAVDIGEGGIDSSDAEQST